MAVTPSIKIWDAATSGWVFVASGGGGTSGGGGGSGDLDQATADTRYINVNGDTMTGPLVFTNASKDVSPLVINRTGVSTSASDADIFQTNYLGERGTWVNEKGNLRTSNRAAPGEDALKIIGAPSITGNHLIIMKDDGTALMRVGSAGTLIAEAGFRLTSGALGAGRVLTSDASGNGTWQLATGGGGSLQIRTTTALTTASLAANASQKTTISLANGYRLYRVTCSAASRVRLYSTIAKRDADETRIIGSYPSGNHGLVLEYLASAALLAMDVTPAIEGFDMAATPTGAIPITITNTGASATTVTVNFDWIRTE